MELSHLVAQRRQVYFLRFEKVVQGARGPDDLGARSGKIRRAQIMDLLQVRASRDQDQPGIVGILGEQDPGKVLILDMDCVIFQSFMELKIGFHWIPLGKRSAAPSPAP